MFREDYQDWSATAHLTDTHAPPAATEIEFASMNTHDDKPWSSSELQRLREGLRNGLPILQRAASLMRDVGSIQAKIEELTADHASSPQSASER
jgi:hypothetical protein